MAPCLPAEIEHLVALERLHLYNRGVPCGAQAIRQSLAQQDIRPLPSVSSIHRILSHHGLTHRRTGFYPDPDTSAKT
jgi:putative transposase